MAPSFVFLVKPDITNATLKPKTQMSVDDMLPKLLNGNIDRTLVVDAIHFVELVDMPMFFGMLRDSESIVVKLSAAAEPVADKARQHDIGNNLDTVSGGGVVVN